MCVKPTEWEKAVEFHGHQCPGLAIGYKAAVTAREKMGVRFSVDEEIVCVTENDACGVDAIQVMTGCSMGKGNLIYRGTGKMAFSFFNRRNGESLRLILKPFEGEMNREERQAYILNAQAEEIFQMMKPSYELPETARLFTSVVCEACGESAPEHKIRLQDGRKVCLDCFKDYGRGW
ncbi:MAG: hypothetical protein AWM53_01887 [Candidatus Dichloromethanomonas elyunquensis]|nr:MAG: hypothetical protein AWM53_01887 [Candidatus Dichloromethanomonas elyunquensis]